MEEKEIWKSVIGHEGRYEVSNYGRVRSLTHYVKRPQNIGLTRIKGKTLKATPHESGYPRVNLMKDGRMVSRYVHTLVLTAFKGRRPNKQDVDHKDRDRTNNHISNLRWLPMRENRGQRGYRNCNKKINKYKKEKNYEWS